MFAIVRSLSTAGSSWDHRTLFYRLLAIRLAIFVVGVGGGMIRMEILNTVECIRNYDNIFNNSYILLLLLYLLILLPEKGSGVFIVQAFPRSSLYITKH